MNGHITQKIEQIVKESTKYNWTHYRALLHTRCYCLKCIVCAVNFCRLFSIFQVWISLGRLHLIHCRRNGRWFSLLSVTQLCHPQYLAFFPLQPMHFHRSSWQCIAGRLCSVILSYAARVLVHKDSMMRSSLFLLMECPRKESWVFLTVCISGFMFLCLQISLFLTWLSLLIFKVILEHCVWKAFILFWTTASITYVSVA